MFEFHGLKQSIFADTAHRANSSTYPQPGTLADPCGPVIIVIRPLWTRLLTLSLLSTGSFPVGNATAGL